MKKFLTCMLFCVFAISFTACSANQNYVTIQAPTQTREPRSWEEAETLILKASEHPMVNVEEIGQSHEGRKHYFVRMEQSPSPSWKVFFLGVQHGDEISGAEAIMDLMEDFTANSDAYPKDIGIYAIPVQNPDGFAKFQRRNGENFDLNRDHHIISQPETENLYRVLRKLRPNVALDAHEYTRDSSRYTNNGWVRWADMTVDAMNHPLLPKNRKDMALNMVHELDDLFQSKDNVTFTRYYVGGPPPNETRPSTTDCDDARNGMSVYSDFSFIAECARYSNTDAPHADLHKRVYAYGLVLEYFAKMPASKRAEIRTTAKANAHTEDYYTAKERYVPVNFLWTSTPDSFHTYKVLDQETKQTIVMEDPNRMDTLAVKKKVSVPNQYIITGSYIDRYAELLSKHGIHYEKLSQPKAVPSDMKIESAKLLRIEDEYDEVYERYAGRQIVEAMDSDLTEIPAGSLVIQPGDLNGMTIEQYAGKTSAFPTRADEVIKTLHDSTIVEPQMIFGLYQWQDWRDTIEGEVLPVHRLVEK